MNKIVNYKKDDFYITTDPEKIDKEKVCELLWKSYWADTRPKEVIVKSLENSLCFSLFHKDTQIGLVRLVTDYATFAYLCDVIIDENYRKNGVGTWLLECVLRHPELENLRRWMLVTKDAHGFYSKFGFDKLSTPERFMEIFNG